MIEDTCIRCESNEHYSDEANFDLRTLRMSCMYQMDEMNIPLEMDEKRNYKLRICKTCRADFLHTLEIWFNDKLIGSSKWYKAQIILKGGLNELR